MVSGLRAVIVAVLLGYVGGAGAQYVYKCETAEGMVYQSAQCAGEPLARWAAVPERLNPDVEQRIQGFRAALSSAQRRQARAPATGRGGTRGRAPLSDCERERRGWATAYEAAGLKRNFALSSHWDNRVHKVCR